MALGSPETLPVVFLFVVPLEGEQEGEYLDEAFLRALKIADPDGSTETRVYRGGVLIAQLSYKTEAVRAEPAKRRQGGGLVTHQESSTKRSDRGLYATLVGDFVESCLERCHTLDRERFWGYVGRGSLNATFVPSLSPGIAKRMDQELRSHPLYIGALSPDLGNLLHRHLFIEAMYKDAFVRGGRVYIRGGLPGTYDPCFYGGAEFCPSGIGVVPYEQFDTVAPPLVLPDTLSARGLVTEMRMERRMALDIHQKVMTDLSSSQSFRDVGREFEWDLSQLPDAPEEVNVQARKIADYLLNAEHDNNQGKAKFFEEKLGITREDWNFLHTQIVDGLADVSFEDVRIDKYGIRFSADMPVVGKNGETATIETGWIVRPGERASLVTAFPGKKDVELEKQANPPPLVPDTLKGDERLEAIYQVAHNTGLAAMNECVPTPLVVDGHVYMEGDCGGALVVIAESRSPFARWLKKNGLGKHRYELGCVVLAKQIGQSAETAKAYADAFGRVLRRNGVDCHSEIYYT